MSYYKDQLKRWLAPRTLAGHMVVSVGNQNDDRDYFQESAIGRFLTIDSDPAKKPDFVHDFNYSLPLDVKLVMMGQVDHLLTLELWDYIWNPVVAISNCSMLLKPGGKLWISSPFIYPQHVKEDPDYLRYTEHFWRRMLESLNFKVLELAERHPASPAAMLELVSADGIRLKEGQRALVTGHMILAEKIR